MHSEERLLTILKAPHASEKASASEQQYVFKVIKEATKQDVMQAVETLFNVKVDKVCICNVKGKPRRFGQISGRRKSWKKAYVKLAEGNTIEMHGENN